MLDLNPDNVRFIIDKARGFQFNEAVTVPEEALRPSDDWAQQVLAEHVDDPAFLDLQSTINDLEPDQQVSLVALMWLGRGDFTLDEWQQALEQAGDSYNGRTAEYLIGTPLLADYLLEGLNQFGLD